MSVRMRHTKAHSGNRRSHHGIKVPHLSKCVGCGEMHIRHKMCDNCGTYRGRQVVDVMAQISKKEKKQKAKNQADQKLGA